VVTHPTETGVSIASRNGNSPKVNVAAGKDTAWCVVRSFLNHYQWAGGDGYIVRMPVVNEPNVSVTNKLFSALDGPPGLFLGSPMDARSSLKIERMSNLAITPV
jgi:hypothetical protein